MEGLLLAIFIYDGNYSEKVTIRNEAWLYEVYDHFIDIVEVR